MSLRKSILLTAFVFLAPLYGCADNKISENTDIAVSRDVFAMDTYMNMKVYGSDAEAALDEAEKRIYDLENELSATSETSDIWAINNADGKDVAVCADTSVLIKKAVEMGDITHGALDITVFPILKEWGFTTGEYHIPDETRLGALLSKVDYRSINIDGNNVSIPEDAEIDLGALAKGYTGDEIVDIFREHGIGSAIISLGGNVQAIGSKPDGSGWKVAVRDPYYPEKDMCVVEIKDRAVITSGNYERFFIGDNGNKYWHIIDPDDGRPADNGFVSVTVIGSNGLICDCLSTALFVAGRDKYDAITSEFNGYDFIFVTDDEKIIYTEGLADTFQNISSMTAEVITDD